MNYDMRQVLDIIHSGTWCSLAAVQADEKRGSGGKIIRLNRCKLHRRDKLAESAAVVGVPTNHTTPRSPHHAFNFTRNLITPGNQIVKIHPLLIFEINGKPVI
jgi:hypothetical protein